jgi:ABC-type Zn uptake system ZnuABC Zn-binding protein ZnuA
MLLLLASAGCSGGGARPDAGRLQVVATVSPITNLVQNVGGDRVDIIGLVPEGADSHTFEPAPSDARVVAEADVVFLNGLHLEEPTLELAKANVADGTPIVELGRRTIAPGRYIFDFSFPRASGDPNPHLWTNPPYAGRYARLVADELSKLDPGNETYYRRNLERLLARLKVLDQAAREVTETIPADERKLLTYHDSFPYFAREYGWEVIGAIQPSDFSEPTAREVARLIDQVESEGVPAIFGSEVFPSPVLEQMASETGAEYIDNLRDDDLPGDPGDGSHSYMGLMVFDFRTFMGALGGDLSPLDRLDVSNVAGEKTAEYRV